MSSQGDPLASNSRASHTVAFIRPSNTASTITGAPIGMVCTPYTTRTCPVSGQKSWAKRFPEAPSPRCKPERRRRLWKNQAEFAQTRTRLSAQSIIAVRHAPLHRLGCFHLSRTWRFGDRAPHRQYPRFGPSAREDEILPAPRDYR